MNSMNIEAIDNISSRRPKTINAYDILLLSTFNEIIDKTNQ